MPDLRVMSGGGGGPAASVRPTAVAIYGFTEHKNQGPLGQPGWENWGLNELYRYMPLAQFSRWFELHPRGDFERPKEQGGDPEHIVSLKAFPIPVYMTQAHPDIPASLPLPKAMIEARVGRYLTSTPAWMLALAIAEGFKTIGLFGIDMAQDTEYQEQRPCMEYLIGRAQEAGIQVVMPKQTDLLKAVAQYGYESEGSELMLKMRERKAWLGRELGVQNQKLADLEADYANKSSMLTRQYQDFKDTFRRNVGQIQGAIDDVTYWMRSWGVHPAAADGQSATPDRSANPHTGITISAEQARAQVQAEGGDSRGATPAPRMMHLPVGRLPAPAPEAQP